MLLHSLLSDHKHICIHPDPPQTHTQRPFIPGKPPQHCCFAKVNERVHTGNFKTGLPLQSGRGWGRRVGAMGTGSSMAALGSWGQAQIQHSAGACPSPALQNPLYQVRERPAEPTLPPAAPQSHTGAAESTKTSITHISWFPTQLPALLCLWNPAEGSRWQIPPDSPPEPPGQGISGHCTQAGDKPWPRWRCCIPGLPRHWADT